jgi:hypothetical protein
MASVMTYAPKDVQLQIEGYTVPGLLSLSLQWRVPPFKIVDGIRGTTSRVRNYNTSAILTAEALQTSVANDLFSQLVDLDLSTGQARVSVKLIDLSGSLSLQSDQSFIMTRSDIGLSNTFNSRSWQIAMLDVYHADVLGNSLSAQSIFDAGSKFIDQYL